MFKAGWLFLWLATFTTPAFAQPCGGVERWPVKVASDAVAQSISLSSQLPISLHDLVFLSQPTAPHDNTTRLAEEKQVYKVEARLLKFKPELGKTGDSDFHLVMTDDTLKFSQGASVSEHSFVAEIVKPDCVPGRMGAAGTRSHFQNELEAVWGKFTTRYPNAKHGWNDAQAVAVRVTGIAFYDFPHGQTGRARNMIEIHPVLDIEFVDGTGASLAPGVLENPGFEAGEIGWRTNNSEIVSTVSLEPARTGRSKAWLGGRGVPGTDTLSQEVSLPSQASSITFAFYMHVSTEEQGVDSYDKITLRLRNPEGQIVKNLRTYSNLQAADGYRLHAFDLTQYKGRKLRIEFSASEDQGSVTSFVLDDLAIIVK